jgi:hypothetical protein
LANTVSPCPGSPSAWAAPAPASRKQAIGKATRDPILLMAFPRSGS